MQQLNISLTFDLIYIYWPYWTNTFDLPIEPRRMRMMIVLVRQYSSASAKDAHCYASDHPSSTIYLWDRNKLWLAVINWFPSPLCSMRVLLLQVKILLIWFICKTIGSHPTPSNIPTQVCWEVPSFSPVLFTAHLLFDLCLNLDMQTLSIQVN